MYNYTYIYYLYYLVNILLDPIGANMKNLIYSIIIVFTYIF
jgi:hypothetical protein